MAIGIGLKEKIKNGAGRRLVQPLEVGSKTTEAVTGL